MQSDGPSVERTGVFGDYVKIGTRENVYKNIMVPHLTMLMDSDGHWKVCSDVELSCVVY